MSKFKFDIKTRDLSWEKTYPKICDKEECNESGEYKAPKSRIKLNEYYYFCLNHVKEYNKSWDFYKGLTVNQIEQAMRKDTIWDRPSWPLKGKPSKIMDQINELLNNDNNFFEFPLYRLYSFYKVFLSGTVLGSEPLVYEQYWQRGP